MIFEILFAGSQLSVVGLFTAEMDKAFRLKYFERLWPARPIPLQCIDSRKKESQIVVASLSSYDEKKKIIVPSSQGRRIVLLPLTPTQYALLFGTGPCRCPTSNVAKHPRVLKGCDKFSEDFTIAHDLLYLALELKGCVVKVTESR